MKLTHATLITQGLQWDQSLCEFAFVFSSILKLPAHSTAYCNSSLVCPHDSMKRRNSFKNVFTQLLQACTPSEDRAMILKSYLQHSLIGLQPFWNRIWKNLLQISLLSHTFYKETKWYEIAVIQLAMID